MKIEKKILVDPKQTVTRGRNPVPRVYVGRKCQLSGNFRTLDSLSILTLDTIRIWRQYCMTTGSPRRSPILMNLCSQLITCLGETYYWAAHAGVGIDTVEAANFPALPVTMSPLPAGPL